MQLTTAQLRNCCQGSGLYRTNSSRRYRVDFFIFQVPAAGICLGKEELFALQVCRAELFGEYLKKNFKLIQESLKKKKKKKTEEHSYPFKNFCPREGRLYICIYILTRTHYLVNYMLISSLQLATFTWLGSFQLILFTTESTKCYAKL